MKRVTQVDVARLAGVSQATVSYIVNGNDDQLPPETANRVRAAIDELGYVPNALARNLRTQRTNTLATVIPDITNPFYPAFQRGVQEVATEAGYDLILTNTDGDGAREAHALSAMRRGRVDGAILALISLPFDQVDAHADPEVPLVLLVPSREDALATGHDTVFVDNAEAQRLAIDHLVARGHRHIGMIAGPEGSATSRHRLAGYRAALAAAGLGHDDRLVVPGDFTERAGDTGLRTLMGLADPPTAVAAVNDLTAIGALRAARDLGLSVPGDVAITGLDDIPAARLVMPELTTVDHDAGGLGRAAASVLVARLRSPETERRVVEMPTRLRPRSST